jgi:hypothetical protein
MNRLVGAWQAFWAILILGLRESLLPAQDIPRDSSSNAFLGLQRTKIPLKKWKGEDHGRGQKRTFDS